jgi:glucose-1-phosphate cytidylyltransferase
MVCEPEVFNYIENDTTIWEQDSLPRLAEDKQLSVFKHDGFWRPMDTLNDKYTLNKYWEEGTPLWKIWN